MSIQETFLKIKRGHKKLWILGESAFLVIFGIMTCYGVHKWIFKPISNPSISLENKASMPIHLQLDNAASLESNKKGTEVQEKPAPQSGSTLSIDSHPAPAIPTSWTFAASKSGKVYYPKDCKALGRVKPANRIFFTSESDALAKGLRRSKSCTT